MLCGEPCAPDGFPANATTQWILLDRAIYRLVASRHRSGGTNHNWLIWLAIIWIALAMYWLRPASRRKGADCVCRIGAAPRRRPSPFRVDGFATGADAARWHAGRRHTEQSSQSGKLHPEPVG